MDQDRRPAPEEDEALPRAVTEVFSLIARQARPAPMRRPPPARGRRSRAERRRRKRRNRRQPEAKAEEVRLLVEPGKPSILGNGEDSTTVTITARGEDGRVLEYLQGPVDTAASSREADP